MIDKLGKELHIEGQLPSVKVEHVEHKMVKTKTRVCEDRACRTQKGQI